MNDRTLLELAARAAGIDPALAEPINFSTGVEYYWNPLTDDGDALRLAVSTSLHKRLHEILTGPAYRADALSYGEQCATRRAITRAAAEIGKSMGGGE
ncbi:hypothetical protein [Pseudomonas aeruginosa]|uniref:hypothetical protein n=1 Tax=Pseudomonas aeruginosa TaxID=287 RepID=UPI0005BBF3B8|nr:hypothetical protein [Pseudomonas aeruginosa]MBA5719561.1 hypothetical protein [Pseudomonas aeruginosa]MDT8227465.1 hypothetical protein [Pseudomonas aeruginosa]HCF9879424.1 hypothetical protein [Pseudomonas aeruginosa]